MKWRVFDAKNGEKTLTLNDISIYSKYAPRRDAWKWVESEFDADKSTYLLIGLGLGYHAERLIQLANGKPVYVYYFSQEEYKLCPISQAVSEISEVDFSDCQILIPSVWIKALKNHFILPYLEDIKINQLSYKKFGSIMELNFKENIANCPEKQDYPVYTKRVACLVASGPSLNDSIHWLKEIQYQTDIFVVGSALKLVLAHDIIPAGVIISDAKQNILNQLIDIDYKGPLFYLSTANEKAVKIHKGPKYLLLQSGYPLAEKMAVKYNLPLLETGGSVSTLSISLLEYFRFEKIILFGQDLGFSGNRTHADLSTSGRIITKDLNVRKVIANDGSEIFTTPNLQTYARWIEQKAKRMNSKLYTTAKKGTLLPSVELILPSNLKEVIKS